jgi:hypothetical protein
MLKKRGAILHAKRHSVAKSKVERRRSSQFPHLIYELLARRQGPKFFSDELTQEMICVRTINEDAGLRATLKERNRELWQRGALYVMYPAKPAGRTGPCGIFLALDSPEVACNIDLQAMACLNLQVEIPRNQVGVNEENYSSL